jgi:DNA-binding GntR family transcriptional regulator
MLCKDLYGLLRAYRYSSSDLAHRSEEAKQEHRRIVEAIAAHDGDRAETLMRKHNRDGRLNLIKRLKADPISERQSSLRPIARIKKARGKVGVQ